MRHTPIPFMIAIPKTTPQHQPPFPVAYWRHGTGHLRPRDGACTRASMRAKGSRWRAWMRRGTASSSRRGSRSCSERCSRELASGGAAKALEASRAIDLNGDGVPDSGGLVWSAHLLHTRDTMRQSVLDGVQLTRMLQERSTGRPGAARTTTATAIRRTTSAGDFNGDGVVDLGGPKVPYYSSGGSFGGLVAQIHGAIDPSFAATAPVSGGGGFVNVAVRSELTPDPGARRGDRSAHRRSARERRGRRASSGTLATQCTGEPDERALGGEQPPGLEREWRLRA